jgi:Fanconi anemia group M protein
MKIIHQKQISDIFHKPSTKIITSLQKGNKDISKIIIDNRERNSLVPSELIKMEIPIEFQQLKVGDYIINNTVIERKTISDFVSSMINKRLFKQLEEMSQYPQQLLLIEGSQEELERTGINPNAIRGFLLTITLKFKVSIIFTKDQEETATYLKILWNKKEKSMSFNVSKRNLTKDERLSFILEGFPNIGPKKSKDLLKEFKTIQNVLNASEEALKKVLGKRAPEFREICEREFKYF